MSIVYPIPARAVSVAPPVVVHCHRAVRVGPDTVGALCARRATMESPPADVASVPTAQAVRLGPSEVPPVQPLDRLNSSVLVQKMRIVIRESVEWATVVPARTQRIASPATTQ